MFSPALLLLLLLVGVAQSQFTGLKMFTHPNKVQSLDVVDGFDHIKWQTVSDIQRNWETGSQDTKFAKCDGTQSSSTEFCEAIEAKEWSGMTIPDGATVSQIGVRLRVKVSALPSNKNTFQELRLVYQDGATVNDTKPVYCWQAPTAGLHTPLASKCNHTSVSTFNPTQFSDTTVFVDHVFWASKTSLVAQGVDVAQFATKLSVQFEAAAGASASSGIQVMVSALELVIEYSAPLTIAAMTPDYETGTGGSTIKVTSAMLPYPPYYVSRTDKDPPLHCYWDGQVYANDTLLQITSHTEGTCVSAIFAGLQGRANKPVKLQSLDATQATEAFPFYYKQEKPTHCYSKTMDGDETGVDDGGACSDGARHAVLSLVAAALAVAACVL